MTRTRTSTTTKVVLTNELFEKAREHFLEEIKPDPLARRQVESWSLQWSESDKEEDNEQHPTVPVDSESNKDDGDDDDDDCGGNGIQHVIHGILEIGGEHLVARIQAHCDWTTNPKDVTQKSGVLHYTLSAQLRYWTKSELKQQRRQMDNDEDKKAAKVKDKIRAKLIPKWQEDAYMKRLLPVPEGEEGAAADEGSTNEQKNPYQLLAEATIRQGMKSSKKMALDVDFDLLQQQQQHLEERVHVADDIAEGLRRAIFSASESSLDVIEVLLYLPFLPTRMHGNQNNSTTSKKDKSKGKTTTTTTPLADRAKLRLLEDAMFDACEREGEDELIEDLQISSSDKTKDSATKEVTVAQPADSSNESPRHPPQPPNQHHHQGGSKRKKSKRSSK